MKTARETFEELGFIYFDMIETLGRIKYTKDSDYGRYYIMFNLREGIYVCDYTFKGQRVSFDVSMPLHNAIHLQLKENGSML